MKIKNVMNTAALAVTLAFAGAAHASQQGDAYTVTDSHFAGALIDRGGMSINDVKQPYAIVQVDVYDMVNAHDARQTFEAFCFEPDVSKKTDSYTATYWAGTNLVSNQVRALYESSYESTFGNADKQFAFQLALWELKADDGNLAKTTGGTQYFSVDSNGAFKDVRVGYAADMLLAASKVTTLQGTYLYTVFSGKDAADNPSQTLIAAYPVPEPETWAMLAAGLGLVGFMGRRKSKKSEQFAA
jgi:hypothetical protein